MQDSRDTRFFVLGTVIDTDLESSPKVADSDASSSMRASDAPPTTFPARLAVPFPLNDPTKLSSGVAMSPVSSMAQI